jgi:hypothetical protein
MNIGNFLVTLSDIDFGWEPDRLLLRIFKVCLGKKRIEKNVIEKNSTVGNVESYSRFFLCEFSEHLYS